MAGQSMLEAMEGMIYLPVLRRNSVEIVLCLEGVKRLCAALYTGSYGGWALFAGGVKGGGGAGGDALCASLYAGGCGEWLYLLEAMRHVLLCMVEAAEGRFCSRRC